MNNTPSGEEPKALGPENDYLAASLLMTKHTLHTHLIESSSAMSPHPTHATSIPSRKHPHNLHHTQLPTMSVIPTLILVAWDPTSLYKNTQTKLQMSMPTTNLLHQPKIFPS